MSSSKIIRDDDPKSCTVSPYRIREMDAKRVVQDAAQQAEEIIKKARAEKEAIEMEAYRKGLEQGQAQGQMMAVKRVEPLLEALSKAVREIKDLRQSIVETHKDQVVELLVLMTERIVHRIVTLDPDIVLETVKQACNHVAEADEIRIRLHPSDFEYIRDIERIMAQNLTTTNGLVFVEDSTVGRGGVILETAFGEIDATIRSQIDHMREVLLEK
ncbi:MAG TPA: FliH/SctL family protein [Deltaproteobacteria bacterium]|nr:FliH/SctL family protein [Deltaproteobacteria bacterium]HOM28587.1 FliH/SctL family protein [Deltaproteobacteria bacterium]HPP80722.1 FliH/SctL family protein [Deltaproteobacteria bacterium]